MENPMAEHEKRIAELEERINHILVYSECAKEFFHHFTFNMLKILCGGAHVALDNTPLDSVEKTGDGKMSAFPIARSEFKLPTAILTV